MQATKIKAGETYAFRTFAKGEHRQTLHRFKVTKKVTSEDEHHSAKTRIYGYVVETYVEGTERVIVEKSPQDLLGPYKDFEETAQREREESEARKNQDREEADSSLELVRKFYALAGVAMPNRVDLSNYRSVHFQTGGLRDGGVEINPAGVALLLEALKKKGL